MTIRPFGDATNMQQGGLGWLRARAGKLTGTDAAIPEEKNPFKTKDQWVREKVRALHGAATGADLNEFVMNDAVRHGSAMESTAIGWFEKQYGFKITETGLVTHPVYGWMAASPDGLKGVSSGIEVKCPFWARTPYGVYSKPYYLWQCHMVMECCDLEDLVFICYLQKSPKDTPQNDCRNRQARSELAERRSFKRILADAIQRQAVTARPVSCLVQPHSRRVPRSRKTTGSFGSYQG